MYNIKIYFNLYKFIKFDTYFTINILNMCYISIQSRITEDGPVNTNY